MASVMDFASCSFGRIGLSFAGSRDNSETRETISGEIPPQENCAWQSEEHPAEHPIVELGGLLQI
jgi:hypothetical protein